jgi:hypothetical protein
MGGASTGVGQRRGLPNSRHRDSAGIPDFHHHFHLNNDVGKLSRLMVATRKYKETHDMQANRRNSNLFNMQKPVANDYALGILVLKVTTISQDSYFDRITESHRDRPTT